MEQFLTEDDINRTDNSLTNCRIDDAVYFIDNTKPDPIDYLSDWDDYVSLEDKKKLIERSIGRPPIDRYGYIKISSDKNTLPADKWFGKMSKEIYLDGAISQHVRDPENVEELLNMKKIVDYNGNIYDIAYSEIRAHPIGKYNCIYVKLKDLIQTHVKIKIIE